MITYQRIGDNGQLQRTPHLMTKQNESLLLIKIGAKISDSKEASIWISVITKKNSPVDQVKSVTLTKRVNEEVDGTSDLTQARKSN